MVDRVSRQDRRENRLEPRIMGSTTAVPPICVPAHIYRDWTDLGCIIAAHISEHPEESSMTLQQKILTLALCLALLIFLFWCVDPYWTDTVMRAGSLA
jgi:hypothetical protein